MDERSHLFYVNTYQSLSFVISSCRACLMSPLLLFLLLPPPAVAVALSFYRKQRKEGFICCIYQSSVFYFIFTSNVCFFPPILSTYPVFPIFLFHIFYSLASVELILDYIYREGGGGLWRNFFGNVCWFVKLLSGSGHQVHVLFSKSMHK